MIREQLKQDCVRLGDFAVKSVEAMKAKDEKGVVRLYTGASQATGHEPQDIAEGVWAEHEEEWNCAANFPEMLRGYASAQSLRKHYYA